MATTIALAISAVLAPFWARRRLRADQEAAAGPVHDASGRWLGALFFIQRGDWRMAALLFGIGNIGFAASLAFYDSLLPHVASETKSIACPQPATPSATLAAAAACAERRVDHSPSTFGLPMRRWRRGCPF
jgi:MFS-type transporter involved in bile tolerance (Atg22 family)